MVQVKWVRLRAQPSAGSASKIGHKSLLAFWEWLRSESLLSPGVSATQVSPTRPSQTARRTVALLQGRQVLPAHALQRIGRIKRTGEAACHKPCRRDCMSATRPTTRASHTHCSAPAVIRR
jgi:hypothetical protein